MAGPVIDPRLRRPPVGPFAPGRLAGLLRRRVVFHLNTEMFVGSYQQVGVVIRMPGVTFDELDFSVPSGDGSTVSCHATSPSTPSDRASCCSPAT